MRAAPRSYFFFLGGVFALFAGCFGAAFAPAFAESRPVNGTAMLAAESAARGFWPLRC